MSDKRLSDKPILGEGYASNYLVTGLTNVLVDAIKDNMSRIAALEEESPGFAAKNAIKASTNNRAYSILHIKSVDTAERVIRGIATTPEADRVGDIVVSTGVKFKNPMPLLLHHQHDKPVGTVHFFPATEKGIEFEAVLPKIDAPGVLKDRVDEAWHSVASGLISAVSIGFRSIEGHIERLKTGGLKFLKSEVIELSLVTIPANASATITAIKSADTQMRIISQQKKVTHVPGAGSVRLLPRARR